jgi:hypothetical protein
MFPVNLDNRLEAEAHNAGTITGREFIMGNPPIDTIPLSENVKLLRQKFYESIVAQSDLMDKLGEKLLTIELAIPGLLATVLKLVGGDKATVDINAAFYFTFIFWFLALILTLSALTPKKWEVDPAILKQDPKKISEGLGIEDFFQKSALYKRRRLVSSSVLFFIGIFIFFFTLR